MVGRQLEALRISTFNLKLMSGRKMVRQISTSIATAANPSNIIQWLGKYGPPKTPKPSNTRRQNLPGVTDSIVQRIPSKFRVSIGSRSDI